MKSSIKEINHLIKVFKEILKIFNTNKCNTTWNNKPNSWFFVNFFPTKYYLSQGFINKGDFITPSKNIAQLLQIAQTPYIKIFSSKTDGCSTSEISKLNKFDIIRYSDNKNYFGQNTFGESDLTTQQIILLIKIMESNPNESIFTAGEKINISKSQIHNFIKKMN